MAHPSQPPQWVKPEVGIEGQTAGERPRRISCRPQDFGQCGSALRQAVERLGTVPVKYLALNSASTSLHFSDGLFTANSINPGSLFTTIGYPLVSMIEVPFVTLDLVTMISGA
jgi:hypothetical protein